MSGVGAVTAPDSVARIVWATSQRRRSAAPSHVSVNMLTLYHLSVSLYLHVAVIYHFSVELLSSLFHIKAVSYEKVKI